LHLAESRKYDLSSHLTTVANPLATKASATLTPPMVTVQHVFSAKSSLAGCGETIQDIINNLKF
jgi:hypothetical protein